MKHMITIIEQLENIAIEAGFLTIFFILLVLTKTIWFKGVYGEFVVNTYAKFFLNKHEYHLVYNITLPTKTGTTQIDHISVSK